MQTARKSEIRRGHEDLPVSTPSQNQASEHQGKNHSSANDLRRRRECTERAQKKASIGSLVQTVKQQKVGQET